MPRFGVDNAASAVSFGHQAAGFLAQGLDEDVHRALQSSERTGRPLGSDAFVARLERALDRSQAPQKPGPKPVGGLISAVSPELVAR